MYETVEEVYKDKIIKENITSLTRDITTSPQDDNVEGISEINNSLMIESGATK